MPLYSTQIWAWCFSVCIINRCYAEYTSTWSNSWPIVVYFFRSRIMPMWWAMFCIAWLAWTGHHRPVPHTITIMERWSNKRRGAVQDTPSCILGVSCSLIYNMNTCFELHTNFNIISGIIQTLSYMKFFYMKGEKTFFFFAAKKGNAQSTIEILYWKEFIST